ncbi:DUF6090 family protein [Mangrovimonas sp. TPBH4]|uniref:DUF6090 family protein n=1 Tax=Mangrovimonas sp. TPBH4 TaxID=1645914 RepID=UPI0006B53D1B|nr:DUF6090 family protein [Mangrovimonas sp. TPBH4]
MIKFFRKIRYSLVSDNKMGKYFKYAVGEIILVVIGILIALQINNWNQSKRDKKFETTMLKEIKGSLESDQFTIKILRRFIQRKQISIQELLEMTGSNKVYQDTVLLELYNSMNIPLTFNYNKGGYEAIKSVGINRITNDSLRNMLILTYEALLPRAERIIAIRSEELANNDYKLSLHNALWKRIRIKMPDNTYKLVSQPLDRANFLNQTEFLDRIKIEQDIVNMYNFWLGNVERDVQKCLEVVSKELDYD